MSVAAPPKPISVVAADAQPLFRDGLVRAIRQQARFQLVADTGDGRAALDAILALQPDVAVVAAALPAIDGRRIARVVRREQTPTSVVVLAEAGERALAYAAIEDGADGVLTRDTPPDQLCDALAAAAGGGTFFAPDVQGAIASEIRTRAAAVPPRLTTREREILWRIAAGQSVPEIAHELHLAPGTVKTHLTHVYERLGVRERAAAVAEAMRRGLLE